MPDLSTRLAYIWQDDSVSHIRAARLIGATVMALSRDERRSFVDEMHAHNKGSEHFTSYIAFTDALRHAAANVKAPANPKAKNRAQILLGFLMGSKDHICPEHWEILRRLYNGQTSPVIGGEEYTPEKAEQIISQGLLP